MNKFRIFSVLLFAGLMSREMAVCAQKSTAARQPNIIIILTDDMGFSDVGAYGGKFTPTPHIDQIAKEGLKFTQYYSAAPICSPSRAGLLTGMYPGRWNFTTYLDNKKHNKDAEQIDFLNPEAPTMARIFKNAGYKTGHFGKWHMGGGRDVTNAPGFEKYGYDAHVSTYESPEPDAAITATNWIWSDQDSIKRWDRTKYFVDKTLGFMQQHKGQPCFINLWPDDVHTPWVPESAGKPALKPQEEEAFRQVLKEYDVQIGRLLKGLKEIGEDQNTIIIFTSDNGPAPRFDGRRTGGLRGAKASLYEGGIRMPFLIRWPGHIPAGRTDETSVLTATDLLPTLAKMAGLSLPAGYRGDGVDRSALFSGKPSAREKEIFWEYGRNNIAYVYPREPDKSPSLAVRSGDWKLLMNHDGSDVELYNMVKDKNENTNLETTQPRVAAELKAKLTAWWQSLPKLVSE
jgi:arylsulfatase A-like enzyme